MRTKKEGKGVVRVASPLIEMPTLMSLFKTAVDGNGDVVTKATSAKLSRNNLYQDLEKT